MSKMEASRCNEKAAHGERLCDDGEQLARVVSFDASAIGTWSGEGTAGDV